jgi:membrane-associated protease RseP (regulator of RpoE activity)
MLATALNLLPGGQLDGGHILYALWPRAHRHVTRFTVAALLGLGAVAVLHRLRIITGGLAGWDGWLVWGILILFTGTRHPQVITWPGLNGTRKLLALIALLMLVLTFIPTPLTLT